VALIASEVRCRLFSADYAAVVGRGKWRGLARVVFGCNAARTTRQMVSRLVRKIFQKHAGSQIANLKRRDCAIRNECNKPNGMSAYNAAHNGDGGDQ
jgi:hypothetical protein